MLNNENYKNVLFFQELLESELDAIFYGMRYNNIYTIHVDNAFDLERVSKAETKDCLLA